MNNNIIKVFEKLISLVESEEQEFSPGWRIVIGQRGWVWVGLVSQRGRYFRIDHAHCIRQWGTNAGLGQLANGPTDSTVLDPCPQVRCHELTVVGLYEANEDRWKMKLLKDS